MTVTNSNAIESTPTRAGVIGVGAMGENHARVYSELRTVELVGVADLDTELARRVAAEYGTRATSIEVLLDSCDVVSIAVPTGTHYEIVRRCLEAGVHVLVEKPITERTERGRKLSTLADELGLVLQIGHIERFNPAVRTLTTLIEDLDVIAVDAQRLGPPVDRSVTDGVTLDLMIHDVDVVQSLLDADPTAVGATGTADGQHATATVEFGDVVATFTASRVTQRKIRQLTVTARDCLVEVDYLDQTVFVYRDSFPEYVTDDEGHNRYRHESIIERPEVQNREPLRAELESFVAAAESRSEPEVTAEDGLRALETVQSIDRLVRMDGELEVRPR